MLNSLPDSVIPVSSTRPRLSRGVRLRWDKVRQRQLLLFPEGAMVLNTTAAAVLELCDGERTTAAIASELESRYQGANITNDVLHLLSRLAERGLLVLLRAGEQVGREVNPDKYEISNG